MGWKGYNNEQPLFTKKNALNIYFDQSPDVLI